MVVYTIGHSTRTLEDIVALLGQHGVDAVCDVRRFPASRRHPHLARDPLAAGLAAAGIGYVHAEALGGRRRPDPASRNAGLRSEAFRGYADHMATAVFARALDDLLRRAAGRRVAVMCAEAVPWRCHRWLLSDALVARGVTVEHILGPGPRRAHTLSPAARVEDGLVTYPPADALF